MIQYFKNVKTLDEAKKLFWDLAKVHHPDKGGDTATFQEILNQFENFKPGEEKFQGEFAKWDSDDFVSILLGLIKIPEIVVEVCGSWIWISGNTKPYKDDLKSIETGETFKRGFSPKKSMWYFSPSGYRKKSKKELSIDEIRDHYGSEKVKKEEKELLNA